ncbi:hypothetical protein TURU_052685 [Turdus rufiventris]|nr:hypothetical protein TURU_052685 [Turdus rufiventris]
MKEDIGNYWPVSLTSILGKVMAQIILDVIAKHGLGLVFGSGGDTEVAPVRSCWKLSSCLAEPIPDGCEDGHAKVGPTGDDGNAL